MGSSGGGDGGMGMMSLMGQGTPMPGLPIAGQGGGVNPREYGMFQNFLPEPLEEGQNPMATGLRPDMLKFRSPNGVEAAGSGGGAGGNLAGEIEALRGELAKLTAGGGDGGGQSIPGYSPFDNLSPGYATNGVTPGRGGVGTMGMGGGGFTGGGRGYPWRQSVETVMPNNPFPAGTPGM